ncbi:unnamed protein product [Nesidiocoris tenuis]|uniref:Cation/H+ exchanger domain-containing protein n=1 Tax=Nesidiocoris tenuis TaxID=355587 RepID=A0A6H5GA57_9HEMI|nr:unnamed protein product [Nesidiocoris tenuis]
MGRILRGLTHKTLGRLEDDDGNCGSVNYTALVLISPNYGLTCDSWRFLQIIGSRRKVVLTKCAALFVPSVRGSYMSDYRMRHPLWRCIVLHDRCCTFRYLLYHVGLHGSSQGRAVIHVNRTFSTWRTDDKIDHQVTRTTTAKPEQGDLKLDVWSDQNTKNFIMISLSFSLLIWLRLITRNHQPLFFMMVLLVAYAYGVLVRRYDYEMVIAILAGFILGVKRPSIIGIHHYGIIVVIFCICLSVRILIILVAHVLINAGSRGSYSRNELEWKRVLVIGLGPFCGTISTMLAIQFFRYDEDLFFHCVSYVVGVVNLSILINATLFRSVLNILGLFEYKRATIVNMNVAMSQINTCRELAIFAQKSDIVVSDANWSIVEHTTRLPHPYKKKLMETGYSDDRGDFRLRTVTCPNCNTEVIAPPTKSEIDDMILEAKQRVLKIQLVSFSQQYENGTLSRHSYRQLFSTIDAAANSKTPIIDSGPNS